MGNPWVGDNLGRGGGYFGLGITMRPLSELVGVPSVRGPGGGVFLPQFFGIAPLCSMAKQPCRSLGEFFEKPF